MYGCVCVHGSWHWCVFRVYFMKHEMLKRGLGMSLLLVIATNITLLVPGYDI